MSAPLLILVENLEFVALAFEPFKTARESRLEFVDALQGVVERDDGAVAGIEFHILHHVVSGEQFRVVACYKVPHHDFVFPA